MDGTSFDAITRTLVQSRSRRQVVKTLVGGALGGLLGAAGLKEVAAACRRVGQGCNADDDCCPGARCNNKKKCVCRAGRTNCAGRCRNLDTDQNNCGACGTECPPGRTCCGGACVDTDGSSLHCGACGRECSPFTSCCNGACRATCLGDDVVRNPFTCACVCKDPSKERCGGQCLSPCFADEVRDPNTCACVCAVPGETKCGVQCLPPCPSGMVRDPNGCVCKCVASGHTACGLVCCPPDRICCGGSSGGGSGCKKPTGGTCSSSADCCQIPGQRCEDGRCCRVKDANCTSAGQCCSRICNLSPFGGGTCG